MIFSSVDCAETADEALTPAKNDSTREKRTLSFDSSRASPAQIQRRITHNVGPYPASSNYIESYSGGAGPYDKNYYETGYKTNYQPAYAAQNEQYHGGYQQQYAEAPEPIIEIIIKESNETLPPAALPSQVPKKKKKEQVQVFYVKYNKDKDKGLVIDDPIPGKPRTHFPENHSASFRWRPQR